MKRILGLLFFTCLMLLKVSAFHVYVHEHGHSDTVEDCKICDIALENQLSDLDVPNPTVFVEHHWVTTEKFIHSQTYLFVDNSKQNQLFCRPPPSL